MVTVGYLTRHSVNNRQTCPVGQCPGPELSEAPACVHVTIIPALTQGWERSPAYRGQLKMWKLESLAKCQDRQIVFQRLRESELRVEEYLWDMLISLSGLCLGQVMLPDGHPDVVSGGLNTRGGGQHVSGGQEDSATHVATGACHRHQPGKLTRPRGSEELSMGPKFKIWLILLAKQEFWISLVARSKTEFGHRGETSLLSPGKMTRAKTLLSFLNFLLDKPPQWSENRCWSWSSGSHSGPCQPAAPATNL